jgi:hypothetical protein
MVHPDDEDVSKAVSNLRRQVETFRFKLEASSLPRPGKGARSKFSTRILATISWQRTLKSAAGVIWFLGFSPRKSDYLIFPRAQVNRIENAIGFYQ